MNAVPRALIWSAPLAFVVTAVPAPIAQRAPLSFRVRETFGIQRTQYPVSARVPVQRGALTDISQVRLQTGGVDVPAQFTGTTTWDDGSIQSLDVDFNASLEPEEERRYQVQFGLAGTAPSAPARGLTVDEQTDIIQVGPMKFPRSGMPLVASVAYRGEGIGRGRNGVAVTDAAGKRHDLGAARTPKLEVLKRGPLLAVVKYSAALPLDDAYATPVEVLTEMPNSKSWLKMTVTVRDPGRRLRDVAIETPFAFDAYPWLWDFGTDSGTYGVLRSATDAVTLTQTASSTAANKWAVTTTTAQQTRRPYETSAGSRVKTAGGWGHFQDAKSAVAFGVEGFGKTPGTYSIVLDGQGQTTFRLAPAEPVTQHQLTVYQHFVPTPVAVGAATNPTSMLNPPVVVLDR